MNIETTDKQFSQMKHNAMKYLHLIILFLSLLSFSCTGGTDDKDTDDNAVSRTDTRFWTDSALVLFRPMEVYYFAQEKDSLLMEAPKVLDFCREHEVWWLFYTAWERKAELFAWVGEFANAAEEAELIRQDAEERGNDYGRAMAYFVLAEGVLHSRILRASRSQFPANC